MNRFIALSALLLFIVSPSFTDSLAGTIIYPGTFDPFHTVHERELRLSMKMHPNDQVLILPIQESYYQQTVVQTQIKRPQVFSFAMKKQMIESIFVDSSNVIVSEELKVIRNPILEELDRLLTSHHDSKLLVGVDVIELWEKIDGFEKLFNQHHFLISLDPATQPLNELLMQKWRSRANVEFVKIEGNPVRSFIVNQQLLANPQSQSDLLSDQANVFISKNDKMINRMLEDYINNLKAYQTAKFKFELLPLLEKEGLSNKITRTIADSNQLIKILFGLNGKSTQEIAHVSRKLFEQFPSSLKRELNSDFYSHFIKICLSDDVAAFTRELFYTSTLEKSYRQRFKQSGFSKGVNKTLSLLQALSWKLIWNSYKKINLIGKNLGLKNSSIYHFQDDFRPSGETTSSNQTVIVYRGVAPTSNLELYMQSFATDGFLSKIALERKLNGATLESALKSSELFLEKKGIKNSVVNHVVGNWVKDTALISTSFDKDIAIRSAGKGGVVYTLEVNLDSGYLVNDPGYWKNTPWQSVGNPNSRLHEFVVKHHIPSSAIVTVEKVIHIPDQPLKGSIKTSLRLLKTVPWYIENCVRLLSNKR